MPKKVSKELIDGRSRECLWVFTLDQIFFTPCGNFEAVGAGWRWLRGRGKLTRVGLRDGMGGLEEDRDDGDQKVRDAISAQNGCSRSP